MKKRIKIKIDIKYSLYKLYKQTTDTYKRQHTATNNPT